MRSRCIRETLKRETLEAGSGKLEAGSWKREADTNIQFVGPLNSIVARS
jgi:hypothetical protein